jgi:hypothetical protein
MTTRTRLLLVALIAAYSGLAALAVSDGRAHAHQAPHGQEHRHR